MNTSRTLHDMLVTLAVALCIGGTLFMGILVDRQRDRPREPEPNATIIEISGGQPLRYIDLDTGEISIAPDRPLIWHIVVEADTIPDLIRGDRILITRP